METVDAVVVGSGFGGSVSAARLAAAGRGVVVLERGKSYPPGSFPRSPREMSKNFWDPSDGMHGMYDIWAFRGIDAVVCAGLGGGSLIYANVLIRKDEHWFVEEHPSTGSGYEYWPVDRAMLDPYYDIVEPMLGANPYPFAHEPYASTPKTNATRDAGARLRAAGRKDLTWHLPNLAVSFGGDDPTLSAPIEGEHLHGPSAHRRTCRLCGECDIGCNDGAKNTLDYNYLTLAWQNGADIRVRHEVDEFEHHPDGGYVVRYRDLTDFEGTSGKHAPRGELRCKVLVISAGAIGSTYLMLRNRKRLGAISPALGTKFCGNGDLLGFIRTKQRNLDPSNGPAITSALRVGDALDGDPDSTGRGFYLEEGGYPEFANWVIEASALSNPAVRAVKFAWSLARARLSGQPTSRLGIGISQLIGDSATSAGTLPVLGMGRDIADGVMELTGKWLDLHWNVDSSQIYFDRVKKLMEEVSSELDAEMTINPTWWLKRVATVHPLGGCPMGTRPDMPSAGEPGAPGVVDDHGEVFGHPGLFVSDGSVMPGPVGPNPSLTIAALGERFSARMIERSA